MEKSTSQILQKARALVAEGWCQGPYTCWEGTQQCHCTAGAVARVLGAIGEEGDLTDWVWVGTPAMAALDAAAVRLSRGVRGDAVDYNEAPRRTQAQVLRLFDEALREVTK